MHLVSYICLPLGLFSKFTLPFGTTCFHLSNIYSDYISNRISQWWYSNSQAEWWKPRLVVNLLVHGLIELVLQLLELHPAHPKILDVGLCINTWIIIWKQINMICLIPTCLWRIEPVQTPITSYAMFSPSLSKSSHSTSPWHLLASSSKVCFIACLSFGLMLSMPGDIRKQHQVLQNNG